VAAEDAVYDREYMNIHAFLPRMYCVLSNEQFVAARRATSPCLRGLVPWSCISLSNVIPLLECLPASVSLNWLKGENELY
jgi:hypothetical protein